MSVELLGPFVPHHVVVVDGRAVPFLKAAPANGGIVSLTLDERLGLDVPVAELDRTVRFIADCIAVGMGYTSHPGADREPVPRPPFVRWTGIG